MRRLDHLGVLLGLLAFVSSLTPSLLPRSWYLQGVVSGLSVAGAYGVGVVCTWLARRAGVRPVSAQVHRQVWYGIAALSGVVVPVLLWLSSAWQNDVLHAVGMHGGGRYLHIGMFLIAAAVAAALIGITRLVQDIYRLLARRLSRHVPRVAARLVSFVLVAVLVVGFGTGLAYRGLVRLADLSASSVDHGTPSNVVQPLTSLRSGGPGSLVAWRTLGYEGRAFVGSGPTRAQLAGFSRRSAIEPIRVYAGLSSATGLQAEADLVLAELRRTHAFDRALLAIATTTGSGWVDEGLVEPLEYMYVGDTAIAAMQYSYLPSWVSFVVDKDRARNAGRVLFNTVYDYWATLPHQHRPRLVVFGESLGAFGSSAAFSGLADLTARTSGALFVGPPNATELWRALTGRREHGTPERLPVYGDGQTVRFAASAADLHNPDGTLATPKAVFLQHASDPVVWWSPDLLWSKPDWLAEPRGPDVAVQMHWFPVITFWQITCDLAISLKPPPGHGHRYGPEIPTAWAAILHPAHWTEDDTAALTAVLAATG